MELKKRGENMSPRTGRPKVENPKDKDIKVRIDEGTHNELLNYCRRFNITKAEAIRKGIYMLLAKE